MRGALVGDCAGSFWENSYNKFVMPQWWVPASHFTDDSICTIATMRWLMDTDRSSASYAQILRETCSAYMERGFASKFRAWVKDPQMGAYGSWGNGSVMRVSPVALVAENAEEAMELAERSAMPTHNAPEAILGARAVAWALYQALLGVSEQEILLDVERLFGYSVIDLDLEQERKKHVFDVSCQGTVPLALAIGLTAKTFDEGLDWCYSMGGDADTLGAVAGPFLEIRFGIPEQHWINMENRFNEHADLYQHVSRFYASIAPDTAERLEEWKEPTGPVIATKRYKIFASDKP